MWIILKNAEEITETYRLVARLQEQAINLRGNLTSRTNTIAELDAIIVGLELENETLQREVAHWQAKAQFNKDEVVNQDA